jgi:hypothetical protein
MIKMHFCRHTIVSFGISRLFKYLSKRSFFIAILDSFLPYRRQIISTSTIMICFSCSLLFILLFFHFFSNIFIDRKFQITFKLNWILFKLKFHVILFYYLDDNRKRVKFVYVRSTIFLFETKTYNPLTIHTE